jgi:hypothetical protein
MELLVDIGGKLPDIVVEVARIQSQHGMAVRRVSLLVDRHRACKRPPLEVVFLNEPFELGLGLTLRLRPIL